MEKSANIAFNKGTNKYNTKTTKKIEGVEKTWRSGTKLNQLNTKTKQKKNNTKNKKFIDESFQFSFLSRLEGSYHGCLKRNASGQYNHEKYWIISPAIWHWMNLNPENKKRFHEQTKYIRRIDKLFLLFGFGSMNF